MPDLVQEVRRRIAEVADPERAPAMQTYMKSAMPFRGVPASLLRRTCRSAFDTTPLPDRTAWEAAVRALWDGAEFREERYAALQLAAHRRYRQFHTPATLALHRHLALTGRWWDRDPLPRPQGAHRHRTARARAHREPRGQPARQQVLHPQGDRLGAP